MFAVDHAATALLIKRRYPSVSLTPLLVSVQAMELAWVGLNYLGIERTTTEPTVRSVADIHLAYMPFSHSVATAVAGALCAWLIVERGLGRPILGRAIAIGIVSHLALDLMTHARDIALWPWSPYPQLGLGLYDRAPMWGFALEMVYGVWCWWMLPGKRIAAGGDCARQPRQPVAVLSRDPWPRTVACRPSTPRRHVRLRADCHDAGPGRLARLEARIEDFGSRWSTFTAPATISIGRAIHSVRVTGVQLRLLEGIRWSHC
jgi:hypothetical protein